MTYKDILNKKARDKYMELKGSVDNNTINIIKSKGIRPAEINSDMVLFKEIRENETINTYYNRVEIIKKHGKSTKMETIMLSYY